MADLPIASSGGTQTTTQSPQALVSSGGTTEPSSSVQPGGSNSNLQPETSTTPTGIALYPTQLPTVSVDTSSAPSTTSSSVATVTTQPKHHINTAALSVSAGLFIAAIIIFWTITRSAKNTTNYK